MIIGWLAVRRPDIKTRNKSMANQSTGKLLSIGQINPDGYRFFKVTDSLYTCSLIFHLLMIPLMFSLGADIVAEYNIVGILAAATCIILNRRGWHTTAFIIFYCEFNVHAYIATHYLGWESGFFQYILLLAPLTFLNSHWSVRLKIAACTVLTISFTNLFDVYHEQLYGAILIDPRFGHYLLYVNTITTVILYSAIGYYYSKAANDSEQKLRTAHREAEWIAHTDPLTHIANRRAMTRAIEREVSRCQRQTSTFIVALADIDDFKTLNDQYSHEYGDSVLVHVASMLQKNIREHDLVARWGGEEFMILLPDTNADEGMKLMERLRQAIAATAHIYRGREYPGITMTFGLCQFSNNGNINDCIHHAYRAMYRGKHQGKNCTVYSETVDIYAQANP